MLGCGVRLSLSLLGQLQVFAPEIKPKLLEGVMICNGTSRRSPAEDSTAMRLEASSLGKGLAFYSKVSYA